MSIFKEERNRVLQLVESGQVTATQAAELLDALEDDGEHPRERTVERRDRVLRIRVTNLNPKRQKVHVVGSIPINLLKTGMRLGTHLIPQLSNTAVEDLLRAIESGASGRVLDVQDLEQGERLEIFVE